MSASTLADKHIAQTLHKVKKYGQKIDKHHGEIWFECTECDFRTYKDIIGDKNRFENKQVKIGIGLEGIDLSIWDIISIQGNAHDPDHYIVELKKK